MKRALILFAKMPLPGKVKTRLTPILTATQAADFYECMLRDTMAKAAEFAEGTALYLFFEPGPSAEGYFLEIATGISLFPQRGNDLGERMENAFNRVLTRGHEKIVIIGSDSPHLPGHFIDEAFARLEEEETDAVLGPSADGGYYLLGLKKVHPELFSGIRWSTETVLRESLEKAAQAGTRVSLLPEWHDVDNAEDLLRSELLDEQNGATLTREFVLQLIKRRETSLR